MVYFYQLSFSTDDVILKLYTSLCQKANCTLFVWSTVAIVKSQKAILKRYLNDTAFCP